MCIRDSSMAGVADVLGCLRLYADVCGSVPARYQRRVDAWRFLDDRRRLLLATKQTEDSHDVPPALMRAATARPVRYVRLGANLGASLHRLAGIYGNVIRRRLRCARSACNYPASTCRATACGPRSTGRAPRS